MGACIIIGIPPPPSQAQRELKGMRLLPMPVALLSSMFGVGGVGGVAGGGQSQYAVNARAR